MNRKFPTETLQTPISYINGLSSHWSSTREAYESVLLSNHYLWTVNARYFNAGICFKHAIRCQRYCVVLPNVCLLIAIHGLALPNVLSVGAPATIVFMRSRMF
ncbi:hypothetical protein CEXT_251741 [Caerostris extrusa]|uniref:Uncharacterized protein n=1 Tax=Caerostris extrusa TaxID=172846 RepID=A0AAV4QXJ4_CAEEX|nr:hypothetical protein CEXT_251741 [Caerostris extrusa]